MSDKPFFSLPFPQAIVASPFDMFMARLVGQKNAISTSDGVIVFYRYKGRIMVDEIFTIDSLKKPPQQK